MMRQLKILFLFSFFVFALSYCGGKDKKGDPTDNNNIDNNHDVNDTLNDHDDIQNDDMYDNSDHNNIPDDINDDIIDDDNEHNSGSETGNPNIVLDEYTGRITFLLTDAPVDNVDNVFVTISEVSVHYVGTSSTSTATPKSEWIRIVNQEQTFDLLQLRNNVTALLGTSTLAVGKYTQVRLLVKEASVVVDGVEEDLEIPSGDKSGIKLVHGFEIAPCGTTTITLDFDAEKSLIKKGNTNDSNSGNGNNNNQGNGNNNSDSGQKPESSDYMMKPTIMIKQSENDNAVCE